MASNTQESRIFSRFGTATVSLGAPAQHDLSKKLKAAARAGFKYIDLFDECWAFYLKSHGQNETKLWDATPINLSLARNLGEEVKSLGMQIVCTQPLRVIEGRRDPGERKKLLELVAKRFPFMRAFDTDLVFMCSSLDKEPSSTLDYKTVAKDLAEMGRMAEEFSVADGGRMLKIGYENLSWAQRNTWASTWEVVHAANRHNVGLIVDSFNLLAVEFADPYNPEGHGRIYSTLRESLDVLRMSLASLVATVPGERIFLVQLGDAERMSPATFHPPTDPNIPGLLPWSRNHRLCPLETERGGYMPVDLVVATILATGYQGPLSVEVFASSLHSADPQVPEQHAERAIKSLKKLCEAATRVDPFWSTKASDSPAYKLWKQGKTSLSSTTSSRI
ncbi:xylose isomerase-like protein [Ilyonectria destructans]|nr:xylose isomerase-like protein [Ilyonectria sp. MPI-CAGE-AT-0026]KAH6981516.1 xylose isomerase-like protein [Ilyonectria destructans]